MAIRIAQRIEKGILPTLRRPGLRDPILPFFPGGDRYSPNYILVINGETVPEQVVQHIVEVDYEDNEELFDQMRITLKGFYSDSVLNEEIPIPQWVQSSTLFSEGNIMWVFMGYAGNVELIGGVEIVKREFTYSKEPQCVITGYEPLHRMANTSNEKAITYKGMRSSDIVKKIGRKSEYSGAIGALFDVSLIERLPIFTPEAEVQKKGESDYAFLKRMADVRGWQLYTRFDSRNNKFKLFYGPDVDKQEGIFRYIYSPKEPVYPEDNLLEFVPTINVIDQNTNVEITSVDEKRKKKVGSKQEYTKFADGKLVKSRKFAGGNTDFQQGELQNPTTYRFEAFGVSKKIIANRPFKSEAEVKKFIINWARETIKNFITATGKVAGNETLQSRQTHYFFGLGETFSGTETKPAKWYISKINHKMSAGGGEMVYENNFDCRKVIDYLPNDDIRANIPAGLASAEASKKASRLSFIGGKIEGL